VIARLKDWALALAGIILAIGAALLYGRHRGREAAEDAEAARDAQANARAQQARNEVDNETAKLPDAPAQRVGDAVDGTAAERLRDRWTRD
jgi:hypothetical protein